MPDYRNNKVSHNGSQFHGTGGVYCLTASDSSLSGRKFNGPLAVPVDTGASQPAVTPVPPADQLATVSPPGLLHCADGLSQMLPTNNAPVSRHVTTSCEPSGDTTIAHWHHTARSGGSGISHVTTTLRQGLCVRTHRVFSTLRAAYPIGTDGSVTTATVHVFKHPHIQPHLIRARGPGHRYGHVVASCAGLRVGVCRIVCTRDPGYAAPVVGTKKDDAIRSRPHKYYESKPSSPEKVASSSSSHGAVVLSPMNPYRWLNRGYGVAEPKPQTPLEKTRTGDRASPTLITARLSPPGQMSRISDDQERILEYNFGHLTKTPDGITLEIIAAESGLSVEETASTLVCPPVNQLSILEGRVFPWRIRVRTAVYDAAINYFRLGSCFRTAKLCQLQTSNVLACQPYQQMVPTSVRPVETEGRSSAQQRKGNRLTDERTELTTVREEQRQHGIKQGFHNDNVLNSMAALIQ
ncbi:hypothetical protein Bbelb_294080 [Branchiostoma belcheri]|nr:hypothetical protein Bbelb_294080 [Branchiostoma belcheri]